MSKHLAEKEKGATNALVLNRLSAKNETQWKWKGGPKWHTKGYSKSNHEDDLALAEQLHAGLTANHAEEVFVVLSRYKNDATRMGKLKSAYKEKYGTEMAADIQSNMSGSPMNIALEMAGEKLKSEKAVLQTAPQTALEYTSLAGQIYAALKNTAGVDQTAVLALLIPLEGNTAKITRLKTEYQTLYGAETSGLEAHLSSTMTNDSLFYSLFILNAPPSEKPNANNSSVYLPGKKDRKDKVAGGSVTARTGTLYRNGSENQKNAYSFQYEGALSGDSRWLQFVTQELEVREKGTNLMIPSPARVPLNTTSYKGYFNDGNYHVDTGHGSPSPFYESMGTNVRKQKKTKMLDDPSSIDKNNISYFHPHWAGVPDYDLVVQRFIADTYLVRDFFPLYHFELIKEWHFTPKKDNATGESNMKEVQYIRASGPVAALPANLKAALLADGRFDRYKYIRSEPASK